jgi:hypothetical protein
MGPIRNPNWRTSRMRVTLSYQWLTLKWSATLVHWSKYDAMYCTCMHRHNPDKQFKRSALKMDLYAGLYICRSILILFFFSFWLVIKHMPKNVRMWFSFHKSKHRYYNVKLLQYELFWMNLTRLSCQKGINFGKLYFRGLSCKKEKKKD